LLSLIQASPPQEAIGYVAGAFNYTYFSVVSALLAPLTVNVPADLAQWDFLDAAGLTISDIVGDALDLFTLPTQFVAAVALGEPPLETAWSLAANTILSVTGWVLPTAVALTNVLPAPLGGIPDPTLPPEDQGLIFNTIYRALVGLTELLQPPQMLQAVTVEEDLPEPSVELKSAEFDSQSINSFTLGAPVDTVTVPVDTSEPEDTKHNEDGTPMGSGEQEDDESEGEAQEGENETPNGGTDLTDGNQAEPGTAVGGDADQDGDGSTTVTEDDNSLEGAPGDDTGDATDTDTDSGEGSGADGESEK
jgi:hypothetical protein